MCSQNTIDGIDSGRMLAVPKWKYILNWWSPVIGIITMIVVVTLFFSNATSRMFDTGEQKYETITVAKETSTTKLDERYVRRDELKNIEKLLNDLKETATENRQDIKRLLARGK